MRRSGGLPRVSVVLPTYNGIAYLSEALDSVLDQSLVDLELIVVDDGSSDATAALLAARTDERMRVLRHPANRGLPASLNTGLEAARGELLTWTSDDNRFHPQALETLVASLEAHPRVDLVYADNVQVDESGGCLGRWIAGAPRHLVRMNSIGACFLFRRSVYERVGGYDPSVLLAEDYDFWVRAWKAGFRFRHVPRALYDYRVHASSLGGEAGCARVAAVQRRVRDRHFGPVRRWLHWIAGRGLRLWQLLFDRAAFEAERRVCRTVPM